MNLDKLQVNACIRSGWQALDLGLLMARAWWRTLFVAAVVPMLPLAVILLAVFWDQPYWALFCLWWLKPFWERLPLFIASRLLFGESPGVLESMRSFPLKDVIPWLLWRRLSMQRAFDNPVTVLEELKGRTRRKRLLVLHGKYSDVAISNQMVGFVCEIVLAAGLVLLFEFFTPDSLDIQFYDEFDQVALAGEWIITIASILAMMLVIPFHSMAGFALYLNRRIELEAWDIEISFRNLANRRQVRGARAGSLLSGLAPWLLLGSLLAAGPMPVDAAVPTDHDRDSAAELIGQVLEGEDFGEEETVSGWRFKDWQTAEDDEDDKIPEWVISFVDWLFPDSAWWGGMSSLAFWLKIAVIVGFGWLLIYLVRRYRGPLSRLGGRAEREQAPEVLFGLDVTPESLPEDVPTQVMRLWEAGASREALSLLYRASLSRLIERYQIAFRASHTEAECAALVRARGIESLSAYFSQLTGEWRRLAYGHRLPVAQTVQSLCQGWSRELGDDAN